MPLYLTKNNCLSSLKESDFKTEKEMHLFVEENLQRLLGLDLVASEYPVDGYFIDTLAYDPEQKSFVIIEYKKDRNFSVVDQGMHYLSLLLNHKAEFVLYFNNKSKVNNNLHDFDWSQVRVLFISRSFTTYQKGAINFKDFPIELWEIIKHDGGLIDFHQIESSRSAESINKITKSKEYSEITQQVKTYSMEDHFKKGWVNSKEVYESLREKLLNIDSQIIEDPQKHYIGFKIGRLIVFATTICMSHVQLNLSRTRPTDINDPEKRIFERKNSMKYFNQHISDFNISDIKDVDYAVFLAKQVYENFIKNH